MRGYHTEEVTLNVRELKDIMGVVSDEPLTVCVLKAADGGIAGHFFSEEDAMSYVSKMHS